MNINTNSLAKNREQWARIDGYRNYEVSWFGRVANTKTGRILKGGLSSSGYTTVTLSKKGRQKTHCIHVLVAREWAANPDAKRCVDHIDGDKTNNHYENLRYATHSENGMNLKTRTNTSSVYKGVYFQKKAGKWAAYIRINRILKHLGLFDNERDAAEAYNAAAIEHFGIYKKLNVIED